MTRRDPWPRAVSAFQELFDAARELESDFPGTIARLRNALRGGDATAALFILRFLPPDYTITLVDDLVLIAAGHRSPGRACEALARLPYANAAQVVPPAVWRRLDKDEDRDTYLQLAGLLDDLGLTPALAELIQRAAASNDPDIREVAEDLGGPDHGR